MRKKIENVIFEVLNDLAVESEVIEIGNKLVDDIINIIDYSEPISIQQAIHILQTELLNDSGYRIGWIANIAMSYKNTEYQYKKKNNKKYLNSKDKHIIANQAAEDFINQLCKQI